MYSVESVLFLLTVRIADVLSGKCSVLCAQYTFLVYRLESVLFLCTVHFTDVPSGSCSVSVHSTHL
jgi:hypothetical protein